jgi:hypothetical protein
MKVENDLEVLKEVLFTTFCYYSTLSYYKNIMDKTGDIYRITRVYVNKTGIDSLNNLLIPFKQTQLFYPICAQMPHYSFLICISIDKKYTKKKIHKIPPELVRMVKEFLIGI